jgi:hypothetical protein
MKTWFLVTLLVCGTSCSYPPSDAAATYDAFALDPRPGTSHWDGRFGSGSGLSLSGNAERDVLRQ